MKQKKINSYLRKKVTEQQVREAESCIPMWILRDGVVKILSINDDVVNRLVNEGKLNTDIDIFHDNRVLYSLKDIANILNESFDRTLKKAIELRLTMTSSNIFFD